MSAKFRVARVSGRDSLTLRELTAYMPSNYRAVADDDGGLWVVGIDSLGWGLDSYVIPRLASGLIGCVEVEGVDGR